MAARRCYNFFQNLSEKGGDAVRNIEIDEALFQNYERLRVQKGRFLYFQGDKFTDYFFVFSGLVKDFVVLPDGEEKVYFIAEGPYLSGSERENYGKKGYRCCCCTITDVEIARIPVPDMEALIRKNPSLALALIRVFQTKVTCLQNQAEAVYQPVPVRIARLLLDRCGYGLLTNLTDPDVIRVTHQDIACFIGATRPNVSKCLADFARQGIIAQEKRSIRTLDRSALAEIAKIGAEP